MSLRKNSRSQAALTLLTLTTLLMIAPAGAQTSTNPSLPPVGQPKPLTLPKIVEETLPNGLKVVVLEDHKQPAVWIRLIVPGGGSINDPKDKMGLGTMTASLLDQGTKTRSESQIANKIDGLGASLGASADRDYATISASGLSSYTDTLMELAADIARNPTFPKEEADRYRTRTLSAIQSALANPSSLADAALARAVYGSHPYGNFTMGTPKTMGSITVDDLKAFHDANYTPSGATLFVVGDITPAKAIEAAKKFLGDWKGSPATPVPPAPQPAATGNGKPRILLLDRPGAAQTEIRIGTLTTGYSDPKRVQTTVANAVLGGGAFGNRLIQEIRVKRGLTYFIGSGVARRKDAGHWVIQTFTKNATTGEAVTQALEITKQLAQAPPPSSELDARKTFLTGSFAIGVATPDGVLASLIPSTLWGHGIEELNLFNSRVQATTPQDVSSIINGLSSQDLTVVLVGDAKEVEPQVKDIGTVTVITPDQLDLTSATLKSDTATTAAAPASPEALAKGKALLDMAVKAHGGEKFLAVKNMTFKGKGTLTLQGNEIPLDSATLITALPDKSRIELKTGLGELTLGSPGGGKPSWLNFGGQVQDQPSESGGGSADPAILILRAVQNNYPAEALNEESTSADGKKLTAFQVTNDKGRKTKVYIEADTGLVRRVEGTTTQGATIILLSNYKEASGMKYPGTIDLKVNGMPLLLFNFDSAEVNRALDDAIFEKPKS